MPLFRVILLGLAAYAAVAVLLGALGYGFPNPLLRWVAVAVLGGAAVAAVGAIRRRRRTRV